MDKPKKDILSSLFCDLLIDNCPTPDIDCCKCQKFIDVFGK